MRQACVPVTVQNNQISAACLPCIISANAHGWIYWLKNSMFSPPASFYAVFQPVSQHICMAKN